MLAAGRLTKFLWVRGEGDVREWLYERREVLDEEDVHGILRLGQVLWGMGEAGVMEFEKVWGRVVRAEGRPGMWSRECRQRVEEVLREREGEGMEAGGKDYEDWMDSVETMLRKIKRREERGKKEEEREDLDEEYGREDLDEE